MSNLFRTPALHNGQIYFVTEDDLWVVGVEGGLARRLTAGLGRVDSPCVSAAGEVAFIGSEEGTRDIYVIPARGGVPVRHTWHGEVHRLAGFLPSGALVYASAHGRPFRQDVHLHTLDLATGVRELLPWGRAMSLSAQGDRVALGTYQTDLARWKRYRGGRRGRIWVRPGVDQPFHRLPDHGGAAVLPMWVGERLFFLSDHTGVAHLCSSSEAGEDLQLHLPEGAPEVAPAFAARFAATDGHQIVFVIGGDLYLHSPGGVPTRLAVETCSPKTQRQRKFVTAQRTLEDYDLHPQGHSLALVARGKAATMAHWEGPVRPLGLPHGVRYRLPRWLDDERVLLVSDEGGVDRLEIHPAHGGPCTAIEGDLGRALRVEVAPKGPLVALTNHRNELLLINHLTGTVSPLDQSQSGPISGLAWSPDGQWLAYSRPLGWRNGRAQLCLWSQQSGEITALTSGAYRDTHPTFDPHGRWLVFLSMREFDPVYDSQYFDLNFPRGSRPYLLTLTEHTPDPFRPTPKGFARPEKPKPIDSLHVDLEGIQERVLQFPVAESRYHSAQCLPGGKILFARTPVSGSLKRPLIYSQGPPSADAQLCLWEFAHQEITVLTRKLTSYCVDRHGGSLAVRSGHTLRVLPASLDKGTRELFKKTTGPTTRKASFIDLGRPRFPIERGAEWRQMLHEAWRLMKENFWRDDLNVDWEAVWALYSPLVDRVNSRAELSDLIWTMQGEAGTSHAYEVGGDHRAAPRVPPGRLAADLSWSEAGSAWQITQIFPGELEDPGRRSPLLAPGVRLKPGDLITHASGRPVSQRPGIHAALAHTAHQEVALTVRRGEHTREVVVRPLRDDRPVRYRSWVVRQRALVHAASEGRIGYVHVPNMGPSGYADFHRDYLQEAEREALLVDVRFNTGGHVSQLILEKLSRHQVGYTCTRWSGRTPYPRHSVRGPMACLTNAYASSDGDIFSHVWKLLGLGPLIGTQTWGGVVGVKPRHRLTDKTMTTQPEFAHWFRDVAWDLENRGAMPDHHVPITPNNNPTAPDPQLDTGVQLLLKALNLSPPLLDPHA